MNSWQPFNMAMIPGASEAIDAVGQAGGLLGDALNALSGLLDTLSQLVSFMSDAMQQSIAALAAIIQGLIDQIFNLLQTGIYFYLDKGPLFTGSDPDGLDGFLTRWQDSFDDLGDSHRPQFLDNAGISAMFFIVGANDLPSLRALMKLLAQLFGIPALDLTIDQFGMDIPETIEQGMSTPPDWESVKLSEVCPPFVKLGEVLMQALGMLTVTDSYSGMLESLAKIIAQKAELLDAISNEIQSVVDSITSLISSSGLYVLQVNSTGIDELINNTKSAGNIPDWNHESWVSGVCLLGGSADFSPVVELFGG